MRGMRKAFTLIELLIVITIIGILAVYLVPRIVTVPQKGRDAGRINALNQIAVALESFKSERGTYPEPVVATKGKAACMTKAEFPALVNALNGEIPVDPTKDHPMGVAADCKGSFWYKTVENGLGYVLAANNEADGADSNYYDFKKLAALTIDVKVLEVSKEGSLLKATFKDQVYFPSGDDNVYAIVRK